MVTPDDRLAGLLEAERAGTLPPLLMFYGHRSTPSAGPWVLSQWALAPFTVDGVRYPTAEHWMMAEKARMFGDDSALSHVLGTPDPYEAKRAGRAVRGFDAAAWEAARVDAVVTGNLAKFNQHPALAGYLLRTAPYVLAEASPADVIWGIGLRRTDPRALTPSTWRGLNLLGFALMTVREQLEAG